MPSAHNIVSRLNVSTTEAFSAPCNQYFASNTSVPHSVRRTHQHCLPTRPLCILKSRYDPTRSTVSCVPLVTDRTRKFKLSHLPSHVTVPSAQHPDMLAMLQELDELINWIQHFTYSEGTSRELDVTVGSATPTSCLPSLERFTDVGSSTSPVAITYPPERHHSTPRESSTIHLPTGTPTIQQPSSCRSVPYMSPLPVVSSHYGMSTFKAFFKKSRSSTKLVPQTNASYLSVPNVPRP